MKRAGQAPGHVGERAHQDGDVYNSKDRGVDAENRRKPYGSSFRYVAAVFLLMPRHASGGRVGQRGKNPSQDPQHDKRLEALEFGSH